MNSTKSISNQNNNWICAGIYVTVCRISKTHGVYDDIGDDQNGIELSTVFDASRYRAMEPSFVIASDDNVSALTKIHFASQRHRKWYLNINETINIVKKASY